MYLAIVAVLLIVWGIIALKERITPSAPPMDDLDKHLKHLSSLPNQKSLSYMSIDKQKIYNFKYKYA